ncbi:MAG: hypothetical protein GY754_29920 [bacterium]|nr:hypothetical protein [bacterium]
MKKRHISGLMLPALAVGFGVSIFLLNTTPVTAVSPTITTNACVDASNRQIKKTWQQVKPHLYFVHSFNDPRRTSDRGIHDPAGNPVSSGLMYPRADPQGKDDTPPHRPTVHGAINELVFPHRGGSWECLYGALIVPFTEIEGRVYKGNVQDLMLWNTSDPARVNPLNILMVAPSAAFFVARGGTSIGFLNSFNRLGAANNITRFDFFPHWRCSCSVPDPHTGKTRQLHLMPANCHSTRAGDGNNIAGYGAGNKESLREAVERALTQTYTGANNRPWFITRCENCDNTNYTTERRFGNMIWRYPPYKKLWVKDPQNDCAWEVTGVPDWYDADIRVHSQTVLGKLEQEKKKLPGISDLDTKWSDDNSNNVAGKLNNVCRKTYSSYPYQKTNRLIKEHVAGYGKVKQFIDEQGGRYTLQQKNAYKALLDAYSLTSLTYAFVSECRCYAKEFNPNNAAVAKTKCMCAFYNHVANGMRGVDRANLPTSTNAAIELPKKSSNRQVLFKKVMDTCRKCYNGTTLKNVCR